MIRRDSEEREMFGRHFVFHSPNGGAREIVKRRPDFLQELFRVAEGHKCKLAFRNDLVQAHLPVHKGRMPSGKDLISLLDELIHLARLLREIKV
jgi:hypothetical protein